MTQVSIVVNNYNYEQFIGEAIESALGQSWPNIQVVVVDDGSSDGSRAIIDRYGDRVTSLCKSNGGQGSALNAAFPLTTGEIVLFLDSDDVLYNDTVAQAVAEFDTQPRLARVQWPLQKVGANGLPLGGVTPNPSMMKSGDLRRHIIRYRSHSWPATSGSAYRRSVLDAVMPIPDEFVWGSDLYLAELTALHGPIKSFEKPGGTYRVHEHNNWMTSGIDVNNIHQRIKWTVDNHEHIRAACKTLDIDCPNDASKALDVAFISQRLASVRLDAARHPIEGDTRLRLTTKGVHAALAHPHHTPMHKLKRTVWLLGVGLGSERLARKLIERFYFSPTR